MKPEARWATVPLSPATWTGIEVDPSTVRFGETVEARLAYQSIARDYPKALSVTSRIGIVTKLQAVATILALRMAGVRGRRNARVIIGKAGVFAAAWGPLPISLVTAESAGVVEDALDDLRGEPTTELVLIDLLRLIEGVRP